MKNDLSAEQLRQEVTVVLPLSTVLRIAELDTPAPAAAVISQYAGALSHLPAIGAPLGDGIYAGLTIANHRPAALILIAGELDDCKWQAAVDWAHDKGGELPSRIDLLTLWNNRSALPKDAFKPEVYWSSEQGAGAAAYAWCQSFSFGSQYWDRKGSEFRARAVRRVPL